MKKFVMLTLVCVSWISAHTQHTNSEMVVKWGKDSIIRNNITEYNRAIFWDNASKIIVAKKAGYNGNLKVEIFYAEEIIGPYSPLDPTHNYTTILNPSTNEYEIVGHRLKDEDKKDKDKDIKNYYFIKIVVKGNNKTWEGIFQFLKKYDWIGGPKSPILFNPKGNLGEFTLSKITPSLSFPLLRRNSLPTTKGIKFWSIDPIITVNSNITGTEGNVQSISYGLSLGGVVDVGGWVQIGGIHDFKSNIGYMVIGIRPELLMRLLGQSDQF